MKTVDVIEGLTILEKYRDSAGGFNCGAGHDKIYVYATDHPVQEDDLRRLVELGWFQDDVDYGAEDEFGVQHYDPEELWACFV